MTKLVNFSSANTFLLFVFLFPFSLYTECNSSSSCAFLIHNTSIHTLKNVELSNILLFIFLPGCHRLVFRFICSRILEIPRASQIFCIWGDIVGVSFKLHLNFCVRVIQTCPSFLSFPFNFSNTLKPWFHLLEVGLAHKLFLSNFEYISDQINLHQRKTKTKNFASLDMNAICFKFNCTTQKKTVQISYNHTFGVIIIPRIIYFQLFAVQFSLGNFSIHCKKFSAVKRKDLK